MTRPDGPLIDGHVFVEHLGEGGYSDVYLYERRSPRMKVAVKVLKAGRLSPQELRQFEAEAETMAELADHPYIVQVFSADTTAEGRPFLVMKFYPKPNLGKRSASERLSVAETLRTGIKIASAVETAHRAGILHRDIKPANVLVSQYDEPGLADFGIAGHAAEVDESDDVGVSVPWSPPEVLSGESNGSIQSDVYSLTATIWHLLVGRSPFEVPGGDNSALALNQRVLHTPPPSTGRGDVPASFERLLAQGMAKNPSMRPRTALELAQALQSVELEQRFATTDIKVGGLDEPVRTVTAPRSTEPSDATKLKAPTRVVAQPPKTPRGPSAFAPRTPVASDPTPAPAEPATSTRPSALVSSAPAGPPAARSRVELREQAPDSTMRRPVVAEQPEDVALAPPRRRGIRPRTAILSASTVVLVAIVLGVLIASGGDSDTGNDTVPTARATDQIPEALPIPVITVASSTAKVVTFRWTVKGATAADGYAWTSRDDDQGELHRTKHSRVALPRKGSADVCIRVVYYRNDEGDASAESAETCSDGSTD